MAKLIGPKNITLSPPKNNWASRRVNKVIKLMLRPVAKGIRPRIVVMAVKSTGRNLLFPPNIMAFLTSSIDC